MGKNIKIMRIMTGTLITFLFVINLFAFSAHAEEVIQAEFQVKNISCGSCLYRIAREFSALGEVSIVGADLRQGKVVIVHDASLPTEKIAKTITDLGYPATIVASTRIGQSAGKEKNKQVPAERTIEMQGTGKNRTTTTLGIANLSCGSCLAKISETVAGVDPTGKVYGNLRTRKVVVVHSNSVTAEAVVSSIAKLGYVTKVLDSRKGVFRPGNDNSLSADASDTDCSGGACRTSCSATISEWKKLYDKFFNK